MQSPPLRPPANLLANFSDGTASPSVRRAGIYGNVRGAQRSTASVPSVDLVRIAAAMGHPELLNAMSGPLPPPPAEEPELDCGPMEDGNALPAILRDFRPTRTKPSYREKGGSRGGGGGGGGAGFGHSGQSSGMLASGLFGNASATLEGGSGKSRRNNDQIVSQIAIAMGRMPGCEGAEFQQHQQLLKSRKFYLAADARGAPYSKDPLDDNADPFKAHRRQRRPPPGSGIIPKWDVDMRPTDGINAPTGKPSIPSGTVQLMCKTEVPANASLTGAKGPGYTDRLIFYCTRDHISRIVRKTLKGEE